MIKLKPFCGTRYGIKDISNFICPPYDVVSRAERKLLLKKSSFNAARIEMPDKYSLARKYFNDFKRRGVLINEEHPSFYFCRHDFNYGGKKYSRTGFFGLFKTEKFGKNIFAHEKTHSGPKIDRLKLLKASGLNTSPIFCLFPDGNNVFKKIFEKKSNTPPDYFAKSKNSSEKIWVVKDKPSVDSLAGYFKKVKMLIADGHHRYETFYKYTRGGCILSFICPFEDKGLLVLPTHRILRNPPPADFSLLEKYFKVQKTRHLGEIPAGAVGLYYKKGYYILKPAGKSEISALEYLHKTFLAGKTVDYVKSAGEAVKSARVSDMVFLIKPISIQELKNVIKTGRILPQKSTYFYPKVSTGIVFNDLRA